MKSEKETSLLVVDDNFDNRNILSRLLKKNNYNTFSAESGVEALSIIENSHIDLVFLDLMMPGMSGFEVLEEIRKTYHAWELPVIVVTARVDTDSIIEAFDKGANDFITKPIIFSAAIARAKNLLLLKALQEKMVDINSELEISVDQKNAELKVTISKLEQEISKGKVTEIALTEAKNKAENATRSRSDFLANMSHELRTPLNAIIGFSELMKSDYMDGLLVQKYKEYATDINYSGTHLLKIINDILDLSKLEANKVLLIEEEVSLIEVVRPMLSILHPEINDKELNVVFNDKHFGEIFLLIDAMRFKQLILNILTNAVKFTNPKGQIELTATCCPNKGFYLTIHDNGIGMDQKDIPEAMSSFSQIDRGLARQYEGTGLGLPLVKSFTELHGGTFELESQKDIGTKAIIWLPTSRIIED